MSCLTAAGPNSDGVGDGTEGTSECRSFVGDLGRSVDSNRQLPAQHTKTTRGRIHGVPAMAASTLLRVGLGGADSEWSGLSSCSGSRVFPCLIAFGGPFASSAALAFGALYGATSASGGNMNALRVFEDVVSIEVSSR